MTVTECELSKARVATPIGELEIGACEAGLHYVRRFTDPAVKPDTDSRLRVMSPEALRHNVHAAEVPRGLGVTCRWLMDYFGPDVPSELVMFDRIPPLCDTVPLSAFAKQVYFKLVTSTLFGETISYGELAELIEQPGAARAVGSALRKNPFLLVIPCHRVIRSNHEVGQYCGQSDGAKQWLLDHETRMMNKADDESTEQRRERHKRQRLLTMDI